MGVAALPLDVAPPLYGAGLGGGGLRLFLTIGEVLLSLKIFCPSNFGLGLVGGGGRGRGFFCVVRTLPLGTGGRGRANTGWCTATGNYE